MIRQPLSRAADHLRAAERTDQPQERNREMRQAASEHGRLRDDLTQAAEHFQRLEAGQPEPTRSALREQEGPLNLRAELDDRYQRAARLAELASLPPEELASNLERELTADEGMRREAARLAGQVAGRGAEQLNRASSGQAEVSDTLGEAANRRAQRAAELAREAEALVRELREFTGETLPSAARAAQEPGWMTEPFIRRARRRAVWSPHCPGGPTGEARRPTGVRAGPREPRPCR